MENADSQRTEQAEPPPDGQVDSQRAEQAEPPRAEQVDSQRTEQAEPPRAEQVDSQHQNADSQRAENPDSQRAEHAEPPRMEDADSQPDALPVFRGSLMACLEFGLVLDAKGIAYERVELDRERGTPESGKPERRTPGRGQPEWGAPESAKPEMGKPERRTPGRGQPEWGTAESAKPEMGKPERRTPERGQPEWALVVPPAAAAAASEELDRYAAERTVLPQVAASASAPPFAGSPVGAGLYAVVLIVTAYCAGIGLFGVDWFAAGALDSRAGAAHQWYRAVTALTLHLDQEHLLGNLLFGMGVGLLAGRMFGPGFAWLSILVSGGVGNGIDMLVSPSWHRAVGASTAVFAALGLLSGFGWGERRKLRERRLYRWAPLLAGVCLLALLGAGNEQVDVLGHLLGFSVGTALGWIFAHARLPRTRGTAFQAAAGLVALLIVCGAWVWALS